MNWHTYKQDPINGRFYEVVEPQEPEVVEPQTLEMSNADWLVVIAVWSIVEFIALLGL